MLSTTGVSIGIANLKDTVICNGWQKSVSLVSITTEPESTSMPEYLARDGGDVGTDVDGTEVGCAEGWDVGTDVGAA